MLSTARVALRKESVDRNDYPVHKLDSGLLSLSARRAWIEMENSRYPYQIRTGRSPQGERG